MTLESFIFALLIAMTLTTVCLLIATRRPINKSGRQQRYNYLQSHAAYSEHLSYCNDIDPLPIVRPAACASRI